MKKAKITKRIYDTGALAIVRTDSFERACEIAEGCMDGGVPVMEISYTVNSAGAIIQRLADTYDEKLCIGAGTVLDSETARHAILHGAQFIIAPNFDAGVSRLCNRYQIPYAPGCTSFSEAVDALSSGAAFIKAFPISDFYGSKLPKIFKTPLPEMPILASGGITLENIGTWLENGVDVCGIGSLLTKGTKNEITENAKKIRLAIDGYR